DGDYIRARAPHRPPRTRLRLHAGGRRLLRRERNGVDPGAGRGDRAGPADRAAVHRCRGRPGRGARRRRSRAAAHHLARGPLPRRLRRGGRGADPVPLLRGHRPAAGRHRAGLRDDRAGAHRPVRVAGAPGEGAQPAVAGPPALAVGARVRRGGVGGRRIAEPRGRGRGTAGRGLPGHLLPDGRAGHRHARPGDADLLELRGGGGLLGVRRPVVGLRRRCPGRAGTGLDRLRGVPAVAARRVDRRHGRRGALLAVHRRAAAPGADRGGPGRDRRAGLRLGGRLAVGRAGAQRVAGPRRGRRADRHPARADRPDGAGAVPAARDPRRALQL
ncbi:MAG: Permeases of the major facilitator superfamily, partial [uncultured Blastococcus sp.]